MHIFTSEMKQIFHKIALNNNHIYVWKVISASSDLIKNPLFTIEELEDAHQLKSEKRKTEFLATRLALKNLFGKKTELKHHHSGRPYIKEVSHISISHSKNYIAIAFGEENIGVDMEEPIEKMLKLIPRILSEREYCEFQKTPSTELACKLWGAKESALKYVGDKTLNYREDIQIENPGSGSAKYLELDLNVQFERIEEMILTIVTG
jgi:phosphopantetheinyl transferase